MRRWILLALALALGLAVPATLTVVGQTPSPTAQNQGLLRVVNASPDSPALSVTSNGNTLFCNLAFRAVTRYISVSSGALNVRILPATAVAGAAGTATAAGSPTAAGTATRVTTPTKAVTSTGALTPTTAMTGTAQAGTPGATAVSPAAGTPAATGVMTATVVPSTPQAVTGAQGVAVSGTLQAGQAHSMVVVGRAANVQTLLLTDDLSAPPQGQAKVRFVHASPDAPAVNVTADGTALFSNVAFKQVSSYSTVPAGTVTLTVTPAGATNAVLTVPNVTLNAGTVYTIYAVGLASGQPALQALLAVESVGGMPVPATP